MEVGAQTMTGDASDPFDLNDPFRGHPLPHRDRALRDPEPLGDPTDQAALRADQGHTVHNDDISHDHISPSTNMPASHDDAVHHEVMDLSTRIRNARKRAGLTQTELAHKLRVNQSAISQWESGKAQPDLNNRIRLSEILKVPLAEILPEAGAISDDLLTDPRVRQLINSFVQLPIEVQTAIQLHVLSLLEAIRRGH